jgi:hypothetical protein
MGQILPGITKINDYPLLLRYLFLYRKNDSRRETVTNTG